MLTDIQYRNAAERSEHSEYYIMHRKNGTLFPEPSKWSDGFNIRALCDSAIKHSQHSSQISGTCGRKTGSRASGDSRIGVCVVNDEDNSTIAPVMIKIISAGEETTGKAKAILMKEVRAREAAGKRSLKPPDEKLTGARKGRK